MKQYTIQGHRTVEKMLGICCNAGQNANCSQTVCNIVLVTETPVKPCLEFYFFWKITPEKKKRHVIHFLHPKNVYRIEERMTYSGKVLYLMVLIYRM